MSKLPQYEQADRFQLLSLTTLAFMLAGLLCAVVPLTALAAPVITEYNGLTGNTPRGITKGPDDNLWFVEVGGNKVGKITTAGAITEYTIPTGSSSPLGITAGPDGNLWFTEGNGNKIGQITPAGVITEYPASITYSYPHYLTTGPDGNLWFTEQFGTHIGKITTAGVVTEYPVPTANAYTWDITAGPDGNLWFTEYNVSKIGRITPGGIFTEYDVPTASSSPYGITAGPDGNLWFTEANGNKIGFITTAGAITEYNVPTASSSPQGITAGPDGNLWFTETGGNKIGFITTAGLLTEYDIPTSSSAPVAITTGPDGNLWFSELAGNQIGKLVLPLTSSLSLTGSPNPSTVGQSVTFTATVSPAQATGIVTFSDGNNLLGTGTLTGGVATFTTNSLDTGSHSITAAYAGDATYASSTSNTLTQQVNTACDALAVTEVTDDGSGSTCGTLSYALNQPVNSPDGQTITFALSQGETVTFTGSLGVKAKANVTINGGTFGSSFRIVLDGNGVSGDGLTLTGNDTLVNLTIKNFEGKELVLESPGNKLQGVIVKAS
ncbi:MAG TPA: Ig-like domain repeat protein [Chloroflexia bacterium]|nr:Ig-like domain repeat protein [Chloroflexia bacterium]